MLIDKWFINSNIAKPDGRSRTLFIDLSHLIAKKSEPLPRFLTVQDQPVEITRRLFLQVAGDYSSHKKLKHKPVSHSPVNQYEFIFRPRDGEHLLNALLKHISRLEANL